MKFTNRQFGELEFDDDHVVMFPGGLIGFERHRKFLIVDDVDSEPFDVMDGHVGNTWKACIAEFLVALLPYPAEAPPK